MFISTLRNPLYFWLLLLFSAPVFSDWHLVSEESKLNFISIKATNIAEIHSFKKVSGSVKENGEAQLSIDLASLETLIPIRNERMGNLLFETKIYPSAVFKLEVDLEKILLIDIGKSSEVEYRGMFGFKNKQFPLLVKLKVTRLSDQSFSVSSLEPLLLNADRLGLSNGIEALRAVAGLPSISKSVPVTFSLMFRK